MNKLPYGWKEYNLSKIGTSYGGLRNKKAKSFSENCNAKYITYKSIYDSDKVDINRFKDVFVDKNENQNLVKYGDAFFTISSETPNEVAMSSVLLDEVENTYLNSFCFGFRFDFNILLPEFARYYFRSDYIRKSTYRLAQGITRYNISKNKFLDIVIHLPPLDEQKRIASALSKIDAYLENTIKLIEEKERFKKGMAKKLLNREARFKGFNDEWETVKLGDLGIITATGVDKKIRDNEIPIKLLNYLDVFNRNKLYEKEISYMTTATEKQLEKCNIRKGDLFITPSSEDREGIAKSSVAMEDFHDTVYSYHIIRVRFNKEIDLKFKSYMCDTDFFHRQAYRLSDGMGQRYFISLNNFRNIEICIPKSIEEQKIIGEYLSLLDTEIDNLKEQKEEIKKMKSGVIKKLMTGEVRL
ncbi:restriction endonuclease subunit S [Brachyspira sp.]|uniref:restriction endonuclease subunit S n=1 Tax=Brachyspira sp. TaxID=1977261 RepID=UPI003D7EDBEF